jgi:hypothetical protein
MCSNKSANQKTERKNVQNSLIHCTITSFSAILEIIAILETFAKNFPFLLWESIGKKKKIAYFRTFYT